MTQLVSDIQLGRPRFAENQQVLVGNLGHTFWQALGPEIALGIPIFL